MWVASDIADWWDAQRKVSEKALGDFVEDHPNWFGIVVAGTTATAMDLGAGLVDVLRLGQGVAEGGVKGFANDGLRLLQFAPAAGKVGRPILAKVLVDLPGGICTWVSGTKALRHVGAKAFASVDQLATAAGFKSISQLGGAFVNEMLPALNRLGARVTNLGKIQGLEGVFGAVRNEGVVLFSVEWTMAGNQVGHTLYAFKDLLGRLRVADRSGAVVKTLAELERFYPGIGAAKVYGPAALVEGPSILIADGIAILAMEIRAQLVVDPETAAQTFEMKKIADRGLPHVTPTLPATTVQTAPAHFAFPDTRGSQGTSAMSHLDPVRGTLARSHRRRERGPVAGVSAPVSLPTDDREYVVRGGDSLSKIAGQYYGRPHKWPVLYQRNRRLIGNNPNLIFPGQHLVIPRLPQVSAKAS